MIDLGDELSDWDGIPDDPATGYTIEDVFALRDAKWSTVPVPAPYGGSRVPLNALQKAGFNTEPPPMWRAQQQLQKTSDMLSHLSSDEDYAAIRQRVADLANTTPPPMWRASADDDYAAMRARTTFDEDVTLTVKTWFGDADLTAYLTDDEPRELDS